MSETTCHMSISLDGFVAGPDQSLEHPLGRRGIELHRWHLNEPLHDADARARDLLLRPRGAYVMGRNNVRPDSRPMGGRLARMVGATSRPTTLRCSSSRIYEHEPIDARRRDDILLRRRRLIDSPLETHVRYPRRSGLPRSICSYLKGVSISRSILILAAAAILCALAGSASAHASTLAANRWICPARFAPLPRGWV